MMIPGRKFFKDEEVFTDWFPRGGDNLIIRAQAIDRSGTSMSVDVELFSKNSETTGDGSAVKVGATPVKLELGTSLTTVQTKVFESAATAATLDLGLYEQVRYKIKASGGSASDWALVRLFPPIFYDNGKP